MTGRLYTDLRDSIDRVERLGVLRRIDGADVKFHYESALARGLPITIFDVRA